MTMAANVGGFDFPGRLADRQSFLIETRLTGSNLTVRVAGELDMATVAELEDILAAYNGRALSYSYLLNDVPFIDVVGWKPIGIKCADGEGQVVAASRAVSRLMTLVESLG